MPKMLLSGGVLAVSAMLVVLVSSGLDLDLESTALLGAALGAVVALVPDRTPGLRLGAFAAGFLVSWIGYVVRAAFLPDTPGGRAVAVLLVVLLCVGVTAASRERLPLWATLLGTAALTGAYEFTFAAAPPELPSTSVSTASTLLLNVAVGFLAASLLAPADPGRTRAAQEPARRPAPDEQPATPLEDLMTEETR